MLSVEPSPKLKPVPILSGQLSFFWFSNEKRSSVSKANDAMVSSDLMAVLWLLVVYSVFSLASAGGHWSYKFGNGKKN